MRRIAAVLVVVSVAVLAGGCGRLAKEGLGVVTGGKGAFAEIQAPAAPLGMYRNIEVGRFTDGFGAGMPPELLSMLPGKIVEKLKKKDLPVGGLGKTLLVQGTIIYYERAAISGQIFGPLEEAVARVELVDKTSKKIVAKSCVVGRSTSTTSQGVGTKAEGLAEGIAKWIAKHSPKAAESK